MSDHRFSWKKLSTKILVSFFVFIQIFASVQPARAQMLVTDPQVAASNVWLSALFTQGWQIQGYRDAKEQVDQGLLSTGIASLIHGFSLLMDTLAYDAAKYIANGGKGQSALVYKQGFGTYLENVVKDSAIDAVDNFTQDAIGVSICQIPDPNLAIFLSIGFKSIYGAGRPQGDCSWQEFRNNWSQEAFEEKYGPGGSRFIAETFSASLKVSNTDFGIALNTIARLDQIVASKKEAATAERLEGEGFKSLTDAITGNVKTPAKLVQEETSFATNKYRVQASNEALWGIAASGAKQSLLYAGSVFLNTLTSELLNQILTKGFLGDDGGSEDAGVSGFFNSPLRSNSAATNPYAQLLVARPTPQLNNFDLISEFASCPESPGINNCVIDTDFQKILSIANTGKPLTIREALDQGLLHGDWPLISPRREEDNTASNCYLNKYCYSNLQKLRKVDILPLGFEIAALRSDNEIPWTLNNVVNNFEKCLRVNERGEVDPNGKVIKESAAFPFCHLINPNWVIRSSAMYCDAKVITNSLVSKDLSTRRQECVDVKTCVNPGPNGSCKGDYAYCTQEKNVWVMPGQSCPSEYNTCTTYTNTKGGRAASYLARTVDYGECSIDNVGCRAYSTEKDANGAWIASSDIAARGVKNNQDSKDVAGQNPQLFFDDAMKSESSVCRPGSNGCTAFYPAQQKADGQFTLTDDGKYIENKDTNALVHLKKAPDYLGCYDANPNLVNGVQQVEWPRTVAEALSKVSQNPACNAFASACVADEVGCEAYNPAAGGAMIPGVIGAQNVCASECVGYATFKQEAEELAKFDHEKFPLFFIPSTGKSCDAKSAGCEEFTNIDTSANGGEKQEYYTDLSYCEKPAADGSNKKTFYTWEGTISQGLSLRTHVLLPVSAPEAAYIGSIDFIDDARITANFPVGSPAYGDDGSHAIVKADSLCNETLYNNRINNRFSANAASADCKAFYDDAGNVFYRLLGEDRQSPTKVVTISAACHPLRKTMPTFYSDETLRGKSDTCTQKGGVYNVTNGECKRCMNGGRFDNNNNVCIYNTISKPGESTSCSAQMNGCRAYTGSTANNVREIISNEDFEVPADATVEQAQSVLAPWSPSRSVRISPESTHPGGHSIEITGDVSRTVASGTFANDGWYELTFWAKGVNQNIEITLSEKSLINVGGDRANFTVNPVNGELSPLSVGSEWRAYKLGPVHLDISSGGGTGDLLINFELFGANNTPIYIDHVGFTQVRDYIYLIKDSWKTPNSCDSSPDDGLPGEALGCAAYKDSKNQTRYATGFEKLCREKAVGCQPFWDTHNTVTGDDAAQKQVFNLLCNATTGKINGNKCTLVHSLVNNRVLGECSLKPGATSCYVVKVSIGANENITELINPASVVPSTVVVPADTPESAPLFLANRKEFQCNQNERGCMVVGLEQQVLSNDTVSSSYKYTDVVVKNDPEKYSDTLCRSDLVGCSEYKSAGNLTYFKDPQVIGSRVCTFQPQIDGGDRWGWFQDGVGTCSNDSGRLCRGDVDCVNAKCNTDIKVACYPDYQRQGGMYDLWSNNSTSSYKGFVGVCPSNYNQCTELIDPADTSLANPKGQPYYVIFNKTITSKSSECNGKVSLSGGCVLFDKTDDPNKLYNTAATYADSEKADPRYAPVSPNKTGTFNSNLILKVDRNRMCSRWLACSTRIRQVDESGRQTTLCYSFRECEKEESGSCVKWVDDFENNQNIIDAQNRLTYEQYITRGTSWYDREFTGYSLYNKFRIDDMVYVVPNLESMVQGKYLSPDDPKEFQDRQFVAYEMDEQFFASNGQYSDKGCSQPGIDEWKACGYDNGGRCYNNKCIYPITGPFPADATVGPANNIANRTGMKKILQALIESGGNYCKSLPETTSPFSQEVAKNKEKYKRTNSENISRYDYQEFKDGYNNVNVCQDGNCSCGYKKITYRNGATDYWSVLSSDSISRTGVCVGGTKLDENRHPQSTEGLPCSENNQCGEGDEQGTCQMQQKREVHYGFKGYCLEYDRSRPTGLAEQPYECLTWLPIQVSASAIDNYNTSVDAGYNPALDNPNSGEVFCAASTNVGVGPYDAQMIQGSYRLNDVNALFGDFYKDDGTPNFGEGAFFGDSGKECKNNNTPYANNICGKESGSAYKAVQVWLSKQQQSNLKNTVLLRVEERAEDGKRPWGTFESGRNSVNSYSFAPIPGDNGTLESGFLMHPPRLWNEFHDVNIITGPGYKWGGVVNPLENLILNDREKTVFTHSLSPELIFSVPFQYLYRSSLEEKINESYLSKVFFLPLSFPGKTVSEVPPLFSQDFSIDFDLLRTSEKKAYADTKNEAKRDDSEFASAAADNDMLVWAYVLERGTDFGDDSAYDGRHTDYKLFEDEGFSTLGADRRNKIEKRYVVFYSDAKKGNAEDVPSFVNVGWDGEEVNPLQVGPPSVERDPFNYEKVKCDGNNNSNWLAIGMDFNSDGEFLGYVSRWCNVEDRPGNARGDDDVGIQFAVAAQVNDMCSKFVQVYDEKGVLQGTSNKAWTQRVWSEAVQRVRENNDFQFVPVDHPRNGYKDVIGRSTALAPYGSLNLLGSVLQPNEREAQANKDLLQNYVFSKHWSSPDRLQSGVPYSCTENWLGVRTALLSGGNCSGVNSYLLENVRRNDLSSIKTEISSKDIEDANAAISDLFVKSFAKAERDNSNEITIDTSPNEDVAGTTVSYKIGNTTFDLLPPQIYSLNTARCRVASTQCVAGEANNVTVNYRNGVATDYDKDGLIDEDTSGDRQPDFIIQNNSITAVLDFFAFADDNRMPIRRVMVNWGDGSDILNDGRHGLYKNRKPYCELDNGTQKFCMPFGRPDVAISKQLTCKEDEDCTTQGERCLSVRDTYGDRFGSSSRACTAGYFEFVHDYTCSRSDIPVNGGAVDPLKADYVKKVSDAIFDETTRQRLLAQGLRPDSYVCIYQPKVQVLDNWGWCNGSCNGEGNTGCYSDQVIAPGRVKNLCDPHSVDAWTKYRGQIIVIPPPPLLQENR